MRIQTILNRVEKFKSFTYGQGPTRGTRVAGQPWSSRWSLARTADPIAPGA